MKYNENYEENKTSAISFVLAPSLKAEFYTICKEKSITPSVIIRKWIEDFVISTL